MKDRKSDVEGRRVIHYEPQRPIAMLFLILGIGGMAATWTWATDVIFLVGFNLILGFVIIYAGIGTVVGGVKGAYLDLRHGRLVLYATRRFHGPTVLVRLAEIERLEWKNRSENERLIAHLRGGRTVGLDYTEAGGVLRLREAINQVRPIPFTGAIPFE